MPSSPMRPCKHPGCGELTKDGWCPLHRPKRERGAESESWHRWYGLPIWKDDLRPAQLLREPFCQECAKRGDRTRATEVDHKQPFKGDWALFTDPANHQSLCHSCHSRKTLSEILAEKQRNFSGRQR